MTPPSRTRFLHVANGTATTRIIRAAGIPGACSIWADLLYEGPVPAGLSDAELLAVRARFLGAPEGPNDLREWRAAIERHESYDELLLWFEHDLFDQLNLIQLLTWIRDHVPSTKPVTLICIGSFPGRPDFKGLGELTPPELAPLIETRQPVSGPLYELARRAWLAFRSPTPEALDALRRQDTSALPHLAPAIGRFLEEYPWTSDGLSRTERRLLKLASGGGIAMWNVFPQMHEGEKAYYVTDGSLAEMAETLARTSPPLLTLDLPAGDEAQVLRGMVTLTDAGRSVLSGRLDKVAACGIDRWLGGVHLETGARVWRWDDGRRGVVQATPGAAPR